MKKIESKKSRYTVPLSQQYICNITSKYVHTHFLQHISCVLGDKRAAPREDCTLPRGSLHQRGAQETPRAQGTYVGPRLLQIPT